MGVYFAPQQHGGSWWDYLIPAVMNIMSQNAQRKHEVDMARMGYENERRAREEALAMSQGDMDYRSHRIGEILGMDTSVPLDARGNPNNFFPRVVGSSVYAPQFDYTGMTRTLFPNMQPAVIDQGNKISAGSFDPGTGKMDLGEYPVTLDPKTAATLAAEEHLESLRQRGANHRANLALAARQGGGGGGGSNYSLGRVGNGAVLYDRNTGKYTPIGLGGSQQPQGVDPRVASGLASLRKTYLSPFDGTIMPGSQSIVAAIDAEIEKLMSGSGGIAPPSNQLPIQPTEEPMGVSSDVTAFIERARKNGFTDEQIREYMNKVLGVK